MTCLLLAITFILTLSILIIWNSNGLFMNSFMFLIGLSATCEFGQNAKTPKISTTTPPLTVFLIIPLTFSCFSNASSIFFHDLALLAFSILKTIFPFLSSVLSRKTSISFPSSKLSNSAWGISFLSTIPLDFAPFIKTCTYLSSIFSTVPVTIELSLRVIFSKLSESNFANSESVSSL